MWSGLVMIAACSLVGAVEECERRWHGYSSFVCVCSATHCDTPEPLDVEGLAPGSYVAYMSSKDGARLQQYKGNISRHTATLPTEIVSLLVDGSDLRQEMLGFGGAMTDATAINIASLSQDAQRHLISSYFSPEGSQYSFVRVPVAGTDFSTHFYTYDDVANDTQLQHFSLTTEDLQLKVPYLQWAQNMSPRKLKLLAAAWSAPEWMLSSKKHLNEDYYKLWADYHVKFVDAYSAHGLQLWGLTGQNEPVLGAEDFITFNSMAWTAEQQATWVTQHLEPALRHAGYTDMTILTLDDQRTFMEQWADTIFGNATIGQYFAGMAVHWYLDPISDPDIISRVHERYPDKLLLYTEACDGTSTEWMLELSKPTLLQLLMRLKIPVIDSDNVTLDQLKQMIWPFLSQGPAVQLGSWERAENYTSSIIQVVNRGVVGWIDWNMALDLEGGPNWVHNNVDSPIIVNASADEFYKQPMYYALAHFSRYVPPGSRRVRMHAQACAHIEHVAFRTPESTTVLLLQNRNEEDIDAVITDADVGSIELTIPARSVHTIIYKG